MSEEMKVNGERIAAALEKLPECEKARLLGFAEGVEAMAKHLNEADENDAPAE